MKNASSIENVPKEKLSDSLRTALLDWGFVSITPIQTLAIEAGIALGTGLFVSSPTSSGKTLIGEIACFASVLRGERSIYFVSHKALADQKFSDFEKKVQAFSEAEITVGLSTGDRDEGPVNADILGRVDKRLQP